MSESELGAERPFPGLRPFDRADADWFFGREEQAYALYRLVDRDRFITVVGGSGTGKSSVVRAGLLHLLDMETAEPGGRSWSWWSMRAGGAPLARLAECLAAPSRSEGAKSDGLLVARLGRVLAQSSFGLCDAFSEVIGETDLTPVLVVDQFEELFRFADLPGRATERAKRREEATHFVQLLVEAARDPRRPIRIVLTMRSDYLGDCTRFDGLPQAVTMSQFLVPGMKRRQREESIRKPVEKAGAEIEASLVQRLLDEGSNEVDQLPVLAHCMMRLWTTARSGQPDTGKPLRLTLAEYETIGRLEGALSRHAVEVVAEPAMAERADVVEGVFRALTDLDRGRGVRRPLEFDQLVAEIGADTADVQAVVDRLREADCSFLVPPLPRSLTPATVVDITHEALIRNWRRLSQSTWTGDAVSLLGLPSESAGWLWEEAQDGAIYQALVTLVRGGAEDWTLPLDQVEQRQSWWSRRRRTRAWAERYVKHPGGGLDRIERLFKDSMAALIAGRTREEEAKRMRQVREDLDRRIEVLPVWDVYAVAKTLVELDRKFDGHAALKTLATSIGARPNAIAALCENVSSGGELLLIEASKVSFPGQAARKEAISWSAGFFADPPFGCFIDLRDRSVITFYGGGYILGRSFQASLSCLAISRAHLVLLYDEHKDKTELFELRSLHGSTINGRPVEYGEFPRLMSGNIVGIAGAVPFVYVAASDFASLAAMDRGHPGRRPHGVPREKDLPGVWGYAVTGGGATALTGDQRVICARGIVSDPKAASSPPGKPVLWVTPSELGGVVVEILADDVKTALLFRQKGQDAWFTHPLVVSDRLHVPSSDHDGCAGFSGMEAPGRFQIGETFVEIFACPRGPGDGQPRKYDA